MFGGFPRGCLSLCCLQASSAAAEQRLCDEGTRRVSDSGRHFSGYSFVAVDKRVTRHQGETMAIRSGKQTSKQEKHLRDDNRRLTAKTSRPSHFSM
jgi:hypothetical protein